MVKSGNSADTAATEPAAGSAQFEHERLLSLINSMVVDGVLAVDDKGRIDIYNSAALNILDSNAAMQGKSLREVCRLLDKHNQPVDVLELMHAATKVFVSRDYSLAYADGSKVSLYLSIAPVHLGYGRSGKHNYVIVMRDISHEKSLEEERDEFISVVSHELRTPITIAEGNISNAQFIVEHSTADRKLLAPVGQALQEAHQQTLFLAEMINDLSTLSRAERGVLKVEIESINVHELLDDLVRSYTDEVKAKGLRLHTEFSPDLELLSSGKLYVREILQNLITNAIKYTEKGHITIGARPADGGVTIWVEDSGAGISKSDQEKIFDKFFRAENYETRNTSGTGLGLYVTMKLARLLHAEITVRSQLGKGSRFSVLLPDLR